MNIINYNLLSKIVFDKEQEFIENTENWTKENIPKEIVRNMISNLCTEIIDEVILNLDTVIGITTQIKN